MKMEKNKDEELQSRREFFKKTAKKALPILGIALFGPSLLTSCDKDEPDGGGGGSDGCRNSCSGSCDDSCSGNCESDCAWGCSYDCRGHSRSY